ncbi:hypothetical protein JCM18237_26630 [Halorubrum luteum]
MSLSNTIEPRKFRVEIRRETIDRRWKRNVETEHRSDPIGEPQHDQDDVHERKDDLQQIVDIEGGS